MIKTMIVVCDGCGVETFTKGPKLPDGWQSLKWVPGLLGPAPGMKEHRRGRHDFCSPACMVKEFPDALEAKHDDPR